jgi:hypothetical protein
VSVARALDIAFGLMQAREMGRALAGEIAPVLRPAEEPEELGPPPFYWEGKLPAGTRDYVLEFGMRARYLQIRYDEDISVRIDRPGWGAIRLSAAESPFEYPLPGKLYTERIFIDAEKGAKLKVFASTRDVRVRFGRATMRDPSTGSFWYWQSGIPQPAGTYSTWIAATSGGVPYEVPAGRRLVVEHVFLSCDVKGEVQRVDLYDYDPATGSIYRFFSTYFDLELSRRFHYPLPEGHQLWIQTYNYNSEDREFRVTIHGYEEER